MERRTIIIVVALAISSIIFLIMRDVGKRDDEQKQVEKDEAAESAPEGQAAAPEETAAEGARKADGELVFDVTSGTEAGKSFTALVSDRGAALKSVTLARRQFDRPKRESEYIPADRLEEGPFDLVSTWDSSYYPFRLSLIGVEWADKGGGQTTRSVRAGAVEAKEGNRLRFTAARLPDDLAIRVGDEVRWEGAGKKATVVRRFGRDEFEVSEKWDPPPATVQLVRTSPPAEQYAVDDRYHKVETSTGGTLLVWPNPNRDESDIWIERRWSTSGEFTLAHETRFVNLGSSLLKVAWQMDVVGWSDPEAEPPGMFTPPVQQLAPVCYVNGDLETGGSSGGSSGGCIPSCGSGDSGPGSVNHPGQVSWLGINSQYFLLAAVFANEEGIAGECELTTAGNGVLTAAFRRQKEVKLRGADDACLPDWYPAARRNGRLTCAEAMEKLGVDADHLDPANLGYAVNAFKGEEAEAQRLRDMLVVYGEARSVGGLDVTVYAGPKDIDRLEDTQPTLSASFDFWFVGFLARPMLSLLKVLYNWVESWAWAIVLLTVLIKLLLLPLTQKSFVNMQKMSSLKPEMDEIREKFGNDKQKMQQEMMNLYKRHQMNPLGGCLPMVFQMPVYIALYRCIYNAVDLYQAPLFGWIPDMTQPDPYYILPILLGGFMVVQQLFMPTSAGVDPVQQKIIKYMMPVMFSLFMLMLPAGLVFYIFVSTVISIGQQWFIKRKYGPKAVAAAAGAQSGGRSKRR